MQVEPIPLVDMSPAEVRLPNAPLARVIAQVRFPPILSIQKEKPDSVADFQEALRIDYPHLHRDEIHYIKVGTGKPNISEPVIWRLADQSEAPKWRVSLGTNFIALETWRYSSRDDFLRRLRRVLAVVEECFDPAEAQRLGLRYIDRLQGEAVSSIGELIQPSVLGILWPEGEASNALREATAHMVTQAQFVAQQGEIIQGRWGTLPPGATHDPDALQPIQEPSWVLDLDMFSQKPLPFNSGELVGKAEGFARQIYSVFRLMVTEEFLMHFGGKP
ncbi:TIGR04255 family protein [Candidatus Foliamicus sp.]